MRQPTHYKHFNPKRSRIAGFFVFYAYSYGIRTAYGYSILTSF